MRKNSIGMKLICGILVCSFITGQAYAVDTPPSCLGASLMSDDITDRGDEVKNGAAGGSLPGSIGNGPTLIALLGVRGKEELERLVPKLTLDTQRTDDIQEKIFSAIYEAQLLQGAIDLESIADVALRMNMLDEEKLAFLCEVNHQTADNLTLFKAFLSRQLYPMNAIRKAREDYLVGSAIDVFRKFDIDQRAMIAVDFIDFLYKKYKSNPKIATRRLAQYLFHERAPEKTLFDNTTGDLDLSEHKLIYTILQVAIFGEDEVRALKRDLREFIDIPPAAGQLLAAGLTPNDVERRSVQFLNAGPSSLFDASAEGVLQNVVSHAGFNIVSQNSAIRAEEVRKAGWFLREVADWMERMPRRVDTAIESAQALGEKGGSASSAPAASTTLKMQATQTTAPVFMIGAVNSDTVIRQLTHLTDVPIADIEQSARKRGVADTGLLGDEESLIDNLVRDNSYVRSRHFTHQQLAAPLFVAVDGESDFMWNKRMYRVGVQSRKVPELSIFHDGLSARKDYTVTNDATGKSISFSGLLPEYIHRYGFYGSKIYSRLDPESIINFFFADEPHDGGAGVTAVVPPKPVIMDDRAPVEESTSPGDDERGAEYALQLAAVSGEMGAPWEGPADGALMAVSAPAMANGTPAATYYAQLSQAEQTVIDRLARKYDGTKNPRNINVRELLAKVRNGKANAVDIMRELQLDAGLAEALVVQARVIINMAAPEAPSYDRIQDEIRAVWNPQLAARPFESVSQEMFERVLALYGQIPKGVPVPFVIETWYWIGYARIMQRAEPSGYIGLVNSLRDVKDPALVPVLEDLSIVQLYYVGNMLDRSRISDAHARKKLFPQYVADELFGDDAGTDVMIRICGGIAGYERFIKETGGIAAGLIHSLRERKEYEKAIGVIEALLLSAVNNSAIWKMNNPADVTDLLRELSENVPLSDEWLTVCSRVAALHRDGSAQAIFADSVNTLLDLWSEVKAEWASARQAAPEEPRKTARFTVNGTEREVDFRIPSAIPLDKPVTQVTFVFDIDKTLTDSGNSGIAPENTKQILRAARLQRERPDVEIRIILISGSAYRSYVPSRLSVPVKDWDWEGLRAGLIAAGCETDEADRIIARTKKDLEGVPDDTKAFPNMRATLEHRVVLPLMNELRDAGLEDFLPRIEVITATGGEEAVFNPVSGGFDYRQNSTNLFGDEQLAVVKALAVSYLNAVGTKLGTKGMIENETAAIGQAQEYLGESGVSALFQQAVGRLGLVDINILPFDHEIHVVFNDQRDVDGVAVADDALAMLQQQGVLRQGAEYRPKGGSNYAIISLVDKADEVASRTSPNEILVQGGDSTTDAFLFDERFAGMLNMFFGRREHVARFPNAIVALDEDWKDDVQARGSGLLMAHVLGVMERHGTWEEVRFLNNQVSPKEVSSGARPAETSPYFIGMSMGATKWYAALCKRTEGKPEVLASRNITWDKEFDLDGRNAADPAVLSPDAMVAKMIGGINEMLRETGITADQLNNVGSGVPGPVDKEKGIIGPGRKLFNLPFEDYPFAKRIRDGTGVTHVDLKYDSETALEAELAYGQLADVKNGYYVVHGTGFGGAMAVDGEYSTAIPEFMDPGHHIVGKPIVGGVGFEYRFIQKFGTDHPFEVVRNPDPLKPHQITEVAARQKINDGQYQKNDFIWCIYGEKDVEDIVAGVGLARTFSDRSLFVALFGQEAQRIFDKIRTPQDLAGLLTSDDAHESDIAMSILKYVGHEMGKALACLYAATHGQEYQLERIVIGSSIGEGLGKDAYGQMLKDEKGDDLYLTCVRDAAAVELEGRYRLSSTEALAFSQQILRSSMTQEEKETCVFDRREAAPATNADLASDPEAKDRRDRIAATLKLKAAEHAPVPLPSDGDIKIRAMEFKTHILGVLHKANGKMCFIGIENTIGGGLYNDDVMMLSKVIAEIEEMKDANGNKAFPNLISRLGSADQLVSAVKAHQKNGGLLELDRVFIAARYESVDKANAYASIAGSRIAAIDDANPGTYLPIPEAIMLNMMAYLECDFKAIKNMYNEIAESVDDKDLQAMIRDGIIYILPKTVRFNTDNERRNFYKHLAEYMA